MKRAVGVLLLGLLAAMDHAAAMDSEERLLFANGLYRRGLHEMALPEFQAILADPAATNMMDIAAFRIGECYRQLGQTNEAAEAYAKLVTDFPASSFVPRAMFRKAELDWQAGRLRDAATQFQKLVALDPGAELESGALYHLALCQNGLDRFADAQKSLRRLVKSHPDSPYADFGRLLLADLLLQDEPASPDAVMLLDDIAASPETPALGAEALAKVALVHYRAGRHTDAAKAFADLASRYPDSPWTDRTRLESGWSFLLAGQTEAARNMVKLGKEAVSNNDLPAWLYLSANIERRDGKDTDALKQYEELLATAPGHELASAAAYEASGIAWHLGKHKKVLELAPKARGSTDREVPLLWMEASSFQALGEQSKAQAAFTRITSEFPASDRAAAAAYQLALMQANDGAFVQAAETFAAIADNRANESLSADARMAEGVAWQKAGRQAEAAVAFAKLIKDHPRYPLLDEAYMGQARAEMEIGRKADAAKSLGAVIGSSTNQRFLAEANYLLGTLAEEEGRHAEANKAYDRALDNKPAPALVRQIQFRRVAVLQRQNRNDEAAALMNTLVRDGSGDQLPPTLLEWLSRWNLEEKSYADAAAAARLLAAQGGNDGWKLLGHYIAGTAERELGNTAAAKQEFELAAAINLNAREAIDAVYQLGLLALAGQQPEAAIESFKRAADRAGSDATMDIRARCYLQLGIAHEALQQWSEAARFYLGVGVLFDDPVLTPESLYRAAGALEAQQKPGQRDQVLTELKQRYPGSDWTRKAGERWP